jgi:iron complex outermembrane receptor protein
MHLRHSFFLLASLALSTQAGAAVLTEQDFFGELPVVLSASRLSQPLAQAPAAVTVIDQDMIRASGFRDIPDLFRLVPGFNVAYTRDNTWGVGYHGLADAYSRRMQVLIDGRSVYTPGFGEVPWASLPLSIEDIERIEVVRGPNAATYGANAFFGVINIITKDPLDVQGTRTSLQAGEQGMRGALFRYGGGNGNDFRYRLSLSDQRRDRFDTQAEKATTRHLDFRGDYRISNSDELTVNFALSRGDWRQGRVTSISDPVRDLDMASEHFQTRFRRTIDPDTEWSLQFYHTRLKKTDDYMVGPVAVDLGYSQWREDVEFQMTTRPGNALRMVWGVEARWEGASAPVYFFDQDDRTGAMYRLFGNLEWLPSEHWAINGGLMAEHHYITGVDVSPRLAVNFLVSPDHALRASIGQAHRSPAFFEKSGLTPPIVNPGFVPATRLDPESIVSGELGYVGHVRPINLKIDARLFRDRVTKLIGTVDVDPTPAKKFQSNNIYHADINGADIQLKWQPYPRLELVASYARVNIDSNDADIAQSAPKNNLSVLGNLRLFDEWEASAAVYRVSKMKWQDDGDDVSGFTRVDARLARRWNWQGHKLDFALVGQNLGGDRYAEFRAQNEFDRRVYISLGLDW